MTQEYGRWRNLEVAITGRLASMRRDEAVTRLCEAGATYVERPGDETAVLVVGQWGPPLAPDGRPTASLRRARELVDAGQPLRIVPEEDFLAELGLTGSHAGIRRLHTTAQLARMLGVPSSRVRVWVRHGLITPVKTINRLAFFDFPQVASARALVQLSRSGVTPTRLRKSLGELARWLPGAAVSLAQLEALEQGELLVRLDDGRLAEPDGQLQLAFGQAGDERADDDAALAARDSERAPATADDELPDDEAAPEPLRFPVQPAPGATPGLEPGAAAQAAREPAAARDLAPSPAERPAAASGALAATPGERTWFERGLLAEAEGRLEEALAAYRRGYASGDDDPELAFNMGNTLYALGRRDEAVASFEEATVRDPTYVEAWNNLANVLAEQGRIAEAVRGFRRALVIAPDYADAHYNLAETLAHGGDLTGAREHWRAYLAAEPDGVWAEDVRARLED